MRLSTAAALFVAGVAAALASGASQQHELMLVAIAAVGLSLLASLAGQIRRGARVYVTIGAVLLLAGFARGTSAQTDTSANWKNVPVDGQRVTVEAWLAEDARGAGNGVRLNMTVIALDDQPADFPLTVFAAGLSDMTGSGRDSAAFRYGDVYEFEGRFSASSPRYATESAGTIFTGIMPLIGSDRGNSIRRALAGIREWLSGNLARSLGEPASGLARTMLVNDRVSLSTELTSDFRESGTSHILAISGLHVALISGLATVFGAWLFGRRGQYYLLLPLAVTWFYAAIAGFSPSVTRAAIMFSIILLARATGRQNSSLPGIGFAAAVMVAVSPEILRSLSFQLSFAAIAGISILTPRIIGGLTRLQPGYVTDSQNRYARAVLGGVAVSVAATLATWPLVAANFGGAPVWGGLATIFMLPAVPLLLITSTASAVAGGISTGTAEVIGWPSWLIGEYLSAVARLFSDLPPGVIDTSGWTTATTVAAYAVILLLFNWNSAGKFARTSVRWMNTRPSRWLADPPLARTGVPAWSITIVAIAAALTWTGAVGSARGGELSVTLFETRRGDIVLIQTPSGNSALIDGGSDPFGAVRKLDDKMPFWDRSLDLLLVTHPDADHIGGLQAVIERYDVGTVAEVPTEHSSTVHAAWRRAMEERDDTITLEPGTVIGLDNGVTLEVFAGGRPFPDATINDASVVTMLRYGDFSMLLTGDITSVMERRLIESGYDLSATVLKVPHHGSDTSSTQVFLDAVNPDFAVVQVGTDNHFGHPTEHVMQRLSDAMGAENVFVTREDGDVILRTDGTKLTIRASR